MHLLEMSQVLRGENCEEEVEVVEVHYFCIDQGFYFGGVFGGGVVAVIDIDVDFSVADFDSTAEVDILVAVVDYLYNFPYLKKQYNHTSNQLIG